MNVDDLFDPREIRVSVERPDYLVVRSFAAHGSAQGISDEYLLTDCDAVEAIAWSEDCDEVLGEIFGEGTSLSRVEVWATYPMPGNLPASRDRAGLLIWQRKLTGRD